MFKNEVIKTLGLTVPSNMNAKGFKPAPENALYLFQILLSKK